MKRIFSVLILFILSCHAANAKLIVNNNTGCEISFAVFAAGFGQCEGYQSQLYTLAPGASVTIANTAALGSCWTYPTYTTMSTPPITQDWSYVKFYSATLCNYYGAVGSCIASSTWQSTCYWCTSGNYLTATWNVSGISTIVDLNN